MRIKLQHLIVLVFIIFSFQFLTHQAIAQIGFDPAIRFHTGQNPSSVTSADFNGDNKLDLAVSRGDSIVLVLIGNGLGHFAPSDSFAAGNGARSIISSDFNGDGKADLATANFQDHNVTIFLGNGSGGFGTATNFTAGSYPWSIINADFNGDGNVDVASTNLFSNNISILLGNGLGGFGTATNFTVGGSMSSSKLIISSDFNGDAKADLAIADDSAKIYILIGNGLGSFVNITNFATGAVNFESIISADFNGDGKADLAIPRVGNNNSTAVFLGNGTGGFGAANNVTVASGNGSQSIVSADFDGDAKADLAVANGSYSVPILLGNGLGSFDAASEITVGNVPYNPAGLISADFNGDGKPDIAVIDLYSGGSFVLLNNPLGAVPITPPICLVTLDTTFIHNIIVWEKSNLNMAPADSFIIYREITTNNYKPIGFVLFDSMSTFDDFGANPASTGYRYKLKSKSSIGTEASSFSNYHNTIYLTNTGPNFYWTPYQIENNITPVASYNVYRDDNSTGNFLLIGNTTGNQLGYTDVSFSSYPNSQYYVEAVMTAGACNPTRSSYAGSRSNVKHFGISGVQQLNNNSLIKIYPNPSTNALNITGIVEKTTIRIYDIVGKLVIEKETENNITINTSLLSEGVYTLLTENKNGKVFSKVVVNR